MVSVSPSSPSNVKIEPPETTQVEHDMSPAAERLIGEEAEIATVPLAFGKVIVLLLVVGSVIAKIV